MSFFAAPTSPLSTPLRTLALAAAASWSLAQAQDAPQAPATVAAVAAPSTGSGTPGAALVRTRAEVVAELACARATGDIDAQMLRSYGLEPLVPQRRAACATGAAKATAQATGAQAR